MESGTPGMGAKDRFRSMLGLPLLVAAISNVSANIHGQESDKFLD